MPQAVVSHLGSADRGRNVNPQARGKRAIICAFLGLRQRDLGGSYTIAVFEP